MSDPRWRLAVDKSTCTASGSCVALAPKRFEIAAGCARPVKTVVEPDESVIDAAESCPTKAIRVYSMPDGDVIAPFSFD